MARIEPKLLKAIRDKSGLSRTQAYARILGVVRNEMLPNNLAAIKVAATVGVPIGRFASPQELAQLRAAGSPVAPPGPVPAPMQTVAARQSTAGKRVPRGAHKSTRNDVFVVHGRDLQSRDAMFAFLRALGIKPIEWNSALRLVGKPTPYVGQILDTVFKNARAIVVILTPDDLAQLRPDLLSPADKPYERTPTGQPRPNVLFEAGMAFGTHPDQTLMVQLGSVREFSDIGGRHVVHMSNDFEKRQELATKLRNAGCEVDDSGSEWVKAGDFTDPLARTPAVTRKPRRVR